MNVLTLVPGGRRIELAAFGLPEPEPVFACSLDLASETPEAGEALETFFAAVGERCSTLGPDFRPELIALRAVYGGEFFRRPAAFCPETRSRLEQLIPEAPLETPMLIALAEGCGRAFPAAPLLLAFETSFFLDLPPEEREFAVPRGERDPRPPRRYGFHGITHAAACSRARERRAGRDDVENLRTISICLDSTPEVAAVLGRRPLMTTSGSSPLQGLPGRTSCGDLDPGIVLALAGEQGWGPEEINTCLTRRSGLVGLADRDVSLPELFGPGRDAALNLAREVFEYRLLLACGAGKAALGGLDVITFSGRHAGLAGEIGRPLLPALAGRDVRARAPLECETFTAPLSRLVAEAAGSELRGNAFPVRPSGPGEEAP